MNEAEQHAQLNAVHFELSSFYRDWSEKLGVVKDRYLPASVRLDALHWIDEQIGEDLTQSEDLERITDELMADEY